MPTDEQKIEVLIEYENFIAGRELSEIIEILDEALWYEIDSELFPIPFRYRFQLARRFSESPPPLFCITEVHKGSVLLTGIISGAAAKYCFDRFSRGFKKSRFGEEIEHLGQIIGNRLGAIVERMNQWLEEYRLDANDRRSNLKSIKVRGGNQPEKKKTEPRKRTEGNY